MAGSKERDVFPEGSSIITAVPHENYPFRPVDENIFTYLLCRFYYDISPGARYTVPVRDVLEFARLDRPSQLHESLRRLAGGLIEIDYVDKDSDEKRTLFTHYLSSDVSHSEQGMMTFAFDPMLVPFLKDPKIFGMINKRVMGALKTVPAQQLYKMMCLHYRLRTPVWNVPVPALRVHMRVGDRHPRFDNFRRHVVEKAVADVNAAAYEFDIVMDEPVLGGKGGQVQELVFRAVPKSHKRILEASAIRTVGGSRNRTKDTLTVDMLDGMNAVERGTAASVTSAGIEAARGIMDEDADLNQLLAEWRELNRGRTFTDPDRAFVEWVAMAIERRSDPILMDLDDDVFGTLVAKAQG